MLVESSYDLTTRLDKKFVEDVKICVCVCAFICQVKLEELLEDL